MSQPVKQIQTLIERNDLFSKEVTLTAVAKDRGWRRSQTTAVKILNTGLAHYCTRTVSQPVHRSPSFTLPASLASAMLNRFPVQ
jgi:hypothetical protein